MKTGYFLSIMLVLQSITSLHGMTPFMTNIVRNSRMLLPTLTNRTAPLFAKPLHATLPKNISLPSCRLFQQTLRSQNFNRNFLIATAGLSLWGYNRLNSMTVYAQEEQLKCSDLFEQFKNHLKQNNATGAVHAIINMEKNVKEDEDYKILAKSANFYLIAAKNLMIQEAIQWPKDQFMTILDAHINLAIMANGSMKAIRKTDITTNSLRLLMPYF